MNKLIPYLIVVIMLAMLTVSWKNVKNYYTKINAEYNAHIQMAEKLESKQVYIDAVSEYESALKIRPDNYEIAVKIKELYQELGQKANYIKACENAISIAPSQKELYLELMDCYLESNNFREVLRLADKAEKNIGIDDEISERVIMVKGQYALSTYSFNIVKNLYYVDNINGYYIAEKDGKQGLISAKNAVMVDFEYDYIGLLSNDLIPVKKNGEYYYINGDGYRKLVPDEKADYFGTFGNGYAPAAYNGVYGYVNNRLKEFNFEYDYAGCFSNGITAVEKNGKWGIINTEFKEVTDFIFDEIVMNDYGFCSTYGVFFAKKGNQYYLYDKSGTELAGGFDDVDMFASDEPAAVKIGGKWGYVSKTGEMIIQPEYEQARSFCIGYGPFMQDGKWGCIDKAKNILIEPTFQDMKPFTKNGRAFVMNNDIKSYIAVTIYD